MTKSHPTKSTVEKFTALFKQAAAELKKMADHLKKLKAAAKATPKKPAKASKKKPAAKTASRKKKTSSSRVAKK